MRVKLLTLLLIAVTIGHAQSKYEEEAKAFFWGADDPYKNVTEIPTEWENESAVVLYKNENYDFHKFGKNVTYKVSIRKRVKLLDQAAVEEFSEFAFTKRFRSNKGRYSWKKKGNNVVGIKIIKPNGDVELIDIDTAAIEVDGEEKIAIPNLQVGDIIDYYYYKIEPFKSTYAFGFDPVETTLSEEYPIVDFKLFFETENDFFINFKSFNSAPELKQLPTEKKNIRRYSLEASNIDKNKGARWFYPLTTIPSYKFQVYFARSGKFEDRALAFLPEKEDIIKTSVAKEEVLELYDNRFKPDGDLGDVRKHFKRTDFKNDTDKVTEAYYFMRHYYLTRFIEAFFIKEADITYNPFIYYGNSPVFIQNQKQFIKHFTAFLRRNKIKYEIVVAKKRYDGTIDELLIERNVEVLVKVLTNTPLYASFFSMHTSMNEFNPLLEGTNVYLLSAERNKINQVDRGALPVSTYKDNESKKDLTVEINDDFTGLNVNAVTSFKGHTKSAQQYDRLLFSDYVDEDYLKYGTKSFIDLVKKKKLKAKYTKEIAALIERLKDKQEKRFVESVKSEFDISTIENYTYKVLNTGRFGVNSYLTYNEVYDINDALIKRAGPNYILEIGKLIGGQITIEESEHERTKAVQMNFPRSYNYNITLKLPEGYTVSGLDKLNKSIDNTTGSFISTAKVEGSNLVITTSKNYKHNYETSDNWSNMIAFLDEAVQFTNEKILLKKK